MKTSMKIAVGLLLSFMVLCTGIGYAALSSTLDIVANLELDPADLDEVVITKVEPLSSTTVNAETSSRVFPTNVKSSITGSAGQRIVYRITAHNYSDTRSFVYTGIGYDSSYGGVVSRLSMSASMGEGNTQPLVNDTAATYTAGDPIEPGEDFVFYVTLTLTGSLSSADLLLHYDFKQVMYTVTYMNGNELYAMDCITDNSVSYVVKGDGPDNGGKVFASWVNTNAVAVTSYPVGNTNDYTLSAKWDSVHLIIFADADGTVIYEETFTDSSTRLSDAGQAIVDAKLAELAAAAAADEMTVAWSDYNIANATSDITVRAVYTYTGYLSLTPVDANGDGITDHYQVDAVAKLTDPTRIPGRFNGLDVAVVNKLYLNDNNFDYGAGVNRIEVGEGVRIINRNALAYTSDLDTVTLPSTLEYMDKNVFSRNFSSDKKVLTIEYNGTMAEWQELVNNSHEEWHNGLKTGSVVRCSDGYYQLTVKSTMFGLIETYTWTAYPN